MLRSQTLWTMRSENVEDLEKTHLVRELSGNYQKNQNDNEGIVECGGFWGVCKSLWYSGEEECVVYVWGLWFWCEKECVRCQGLCQELYDPVRCRME